MISSNELGTLTGRTLVGADNEKLGKIVDVYESADSADGTFVTVSTGLFGNHHSFVPLREATVNGHDVLVPYNKAQVKEAPRVAADEELTSAEEERLYAHYGLGQGAAQGTGSAAEPEALDAMGTQGGHEEATSSSTDTMVRSEERLQVGTEQVESGRARLVKRIVTENVSTTVPVSHEEIVLEREPIAAGQAGTVSGGATLSEQEQEVVLHEERLVVTKETVPVEQVRLGTQTVTEERQVQETVRKEQIETEGLQGEQPGR